MIIRFIIALAVGIFLQAFLGESRAATVRVFLLGGQSNMSGRAEGANFPANLQTPVGSVFFYNGFDSGGLQENLMNSVQINTSETGQTGPEVSFAASLRDSFPATPFAFIKYAEGGTSLASDWAPGGDGTASGDGIHYQNFQTIVTNAMTQFQLASPGDTFSIEGFLWTQGERDAKTGRSTAQYQTDLANFVADVRLTYGADIPFLYSRLSDNQIDMTPAQLSSIQTAQDNVNSAVAHTFLINTDTFSVKGDNLHFDADGQIDLGEAFSSAAVSAGAVPEPASSFFLLVGLVCVSFLRVR